MELNLKKYLKKFEQLLPYEVKVRNAVIDSFTELFSVTLERKTIRVSGSRVYIQTNASLKNEIHLKQQLILKKIKEKDTSITITHIL